MAAAQRLKIEQILWNISASWKMMPRCFTGCMARLSSENSRLGCRFYYCWYLYCPSILPNDRKFPSFCFLFHLCSANVKPDWQCGEDWSGGENQNSWERANFILLSLRAPKQCPFALSWTINIFEIPELTDRHRTEPKSDPPWPKKKSNWIVENPSNGRMNLAVYV